MDDILTQVTQLANMHLARLELEAARVLLRDAFMVLPWELQEDYREIQELYRMGRRWEANQAWDEWLDKAREMGLI